MVARSMLKPPFKIIKVDFMVPNFDLVMFG